jgi:hypothetical protein
VAARPGADRDPGGRLYHQLPLVRAAELKNRMGGDYLNTREPHFWRHYLFSAIAGTTWYLQFMFYGMDTSFMRQ